MSEKSGAPYNDLSLLAIAGQWRDGSAGKILRVSNPYTGETLVQIAQAGREDLDEAFLAAERAQKDWAAMGPGQRTTILLRAVQIMDERREEIIDWIIQESGSTRIKAQIEWGAARAITQESASFPTRVHGKILPSNIVGKENRVYREPLGVIGVISPWNFPFHLTQRSVAPAVALGNAVVIKPSSDTPVTGGLLAARIFEEAGVPPGVISVLVGAGADIGDALVEHHVPTFISFTGSTLVGANIGRIASDGKYLKYVALELSGNSPFVVLADADLDQAVAAAVIGKSLHQGQICMAVNRIIVEDALYDRFVEKYSAKVKMLKVGDPNDQDTVIGPIINRRHLVGLLAKVNRAKEEGARPVVEGDIEGLLLPPHVFADVTAEMEIAREEIFGPVVGIQRARDEAHALELANCGEYGLSSAVFTKDLERGARFARKIKSGMAYVNDIPVNDEANVPFGGEKNFGLSLFIGEWAIEEFTRDHWTSVQMTPRQYPF